jgi:hypothetical protein
MAAEAFAAVNASGKQTYAGSKHLSVIVAERAPSLGNLTRIITEMRGPFVGQLQFERDRSRSRASRSRSLCERPAVIPNVDSQGRVPVTDLTYVRGHTLMSHAKRRILVQLTEEQIAALRARRITLGVPVAEQIRRAVNLMLFADAKPRKIEYRKSSGEQCLFPDQESEA